MVFIDELLSKLAPHDCLGCGAEGRLLCVGCLHSLPASPALKLSEGSPLDNMAAAVIYKSLAKQLIWKLKSNGAQEAAILMAEAMAPLVSSRGVFVTVPTATSRP